MLMKCDVCSEVFKSQGNGSIERVDNNVELIWFTCPKCKNKYLIYATNNKIKMLQDKVRVELKKEKPNLKALDENAIKICNEQQKLRRKYENK